MVKNGPKQVKTGPKLSKSCLVQNCPKVVPKPVWNPVRTPLQPLYPVFVPFFFSFFRGLLKADGKHVFFLFCVFLSFFVFLFFPFYYFFHGLLKADGKHAIYIFYLYIYIFFNDYSYHYFFFFSWPSESWWKTRFFLFFSRGLLRISFFFLFFSGIFRTPKLFQSPFLFHCCSPLVLLWVGPGGLLCRGSTEGFSGGFLTCFGPFLTILGFSGRFFGFPGRILGFRGSFWVSGAVLGFPRRFWGDFWVSGAILGVWGGVFGGG